MANAIITSSIITNETLRILHNESAFLGNINTEYEDQFANKGMKAGSVVNVRQPVQYTIRDGATINIQDVNELTVPITMEAEFGIDWAFSDYDLKLSIDEFSKRYLAPAAKRLAAELDLRIATRFYRGVANFSGTPGTPISTAQAVLDAAVLLDNAACPRTDGRMLALTPLSNAKLVGGMSGLFNDQATQGKQLKNGMMSTNLGLDFIMSQNLPTHTVGGLGGTPLTNGANQGLINSGSTDNPSAATTSLVTDGWTAAVANRLKRGDVFTIAGVFAVNPETKVSTGVLRQFIATADAASDGAGNLTVAIYPAIIAGGAYQNVTARAADNSAITVLTGTASTAYGQNLMFHRDAFTLVTADMELPKGMDMADRAVEDGVSIRFVRGYDITNNRRICRFDLLAGYGLLRPEWAVRVTQ
jgi:hypothetical protein